MSETGEAAVAVGGYHIDLPVVLRVVVPDIPLDLACVQLHRVEMAFLSVAWCTEMPYLSLQPIAAAR